MPVEPSEALTVTSIAFWIGPIIQAGAILVSAACVAWMIRTNRAIARQRAVLDFIVKEQTDSDMLEARKRFVKLKQDGAMEQYAAPAQLASEQAADIRFILNMYEVMAIGIKKNAYEEAIYKDWCRTTAVKDWIACKGFVSRYQSDYNPRIYQEFEKLAKKWATPDEAKHC
ncbi:DUF4760 domain-containing protein [Nitratireductor sp. StC3]|uniref:DUF4760 domain-containing protein n=1 Tax=Nitratireductor sp. StC3 TaxID=2126741 RepID=UPI000D0D89FA|nr:DUF4760 domain-containing protein [Nitratireductor sp. StC3]PSM16186.1 hypothetical protein C7T96_21145 [Nitratireductor sp. StC3]